MKPIHFRAHYVKDKIVLDSIKGINAVKENKPVKGHIGGGIAVQSYLPEEEYRDTIDLDFTLYWNGSLTDFKDLMNPLTDSLKSLGYRPSYSKKGLTYELIISTENDSLLLQHPRRSPTNYEKNKRSLEREISNNRILTKEGISYATLSPDDLALHKINRTLAFKDRYSLNIPNNCDLLSLRKSADALKEDLLSRWPSVEPQEVARLRLVNDMFDVKCLATYVGFNKPYFLEGSKDWVTDKIKLEDTLNVLDALQVELK